MNALTLHPHVAGARHRIGQTIQMVIASAAALLLATACGASTRQPADAANAQEVIVVASDTMRFTPSTVTVAAGRPVRLVLKNEGALVHDITLRPGPAGTAKQVRVVAAGKGTGTAAFVPTASGTYAFVCSQAGHEAAGMTGSFSAVVVAGAAGAALAAAPPSVS